MNERDLHPYQIEAVEHILKHTHCGLFLEMGLGKTVSTLTAINKLMYEDLEINKVLIIAPKRVAENVWDAEINKWDHLHNLRI
jgi:SNF2 family DNA or RNA helicase